MIDIEEQHNIEFEEIYFSELGMCGCGNPEDVKKFLYALIKNHKDYKDEKISYESMSENRSKIISETNPDIIFEFVFHVLEHSGLVEHGSSVYGSWFTDKGERFFNLLYQNISRHDNF